MKKTRQELRNEIMRLKRKVDYWEKRQSKAEEAMCRHFAPFKNGDRVIVRGRDEGSRVRRGIVWRVDYEPGAWDAIDGFTMQMAMATKDWECCQPHRAVSYGPKWDTIEKVPRSNGGQTDEARQNTSGSVDP